MTVWDVALFALWLALAVACGLNWRAQVRWHRHYLDRLGPEGVTRSPVRQRPHDS